MPLFPCHYPTTITTTTTPPRTWWAMALEACQGNFLQLSRVVWVSTSNISATAKCKWTQQTCVDCHVTHKPQCRAQRTNMMVQKCCVQQLTLQEPVPCLKNLRFSQFSQNQSGSSVLPTDSFVLKHKPQ